MININTKKILWNPYQPLYMTEAKKEPKEMEK